MPAAKIPAHAQRQQRYCNQRQSFEPKGHSRNAWQPAPIGKSYGRLSIPIGLRGICKPLAIAQPNMTCTNFRNMIQHELQSSPASMPDFEAFLQPKNEATYLASFHCGKKSLYGHDAFTRYHQCYLFQLFHLRDQRLSQRLPTTQERDLLILVQRLRELCIW